MIYYIAIHCILLLLIMLYINIMFVFRSFNSIEVHVYLVFQKHLLSFFTFSFRIVSVIND